MTRVIAFLSHADKDKIMAEKIAEELKKHHYDVFVAHRDIDPGSDWENVLKQRIDECDLFLILLSANFKQADYASQEVGIAICKDKKIFPFSIDGTMPYGFMSKYQSGPFDTGDIVGEAKRISEQFRRAIDGTLRSIDTLISALRFASSFREANQIARELSSYTDFTDGQLEAMAAAYNQNFEARGSWTAGPYIRDLLQERGKLDLLDHDEDSA